MPSPNGGPIPCHNYVQTILMRAISVLFCLIMAIPSFAASSDDWPAYGGDAGGQKFSRLDQINVKNVNSLKVAWTYHTGDAYQPKDRRATAFEATPLYVDATVFLATPLGRAVALNPVTGQVRWTFDAKIDRNAGYGDYATRGVSTWKAPNGRRRIYLATIDARLIALDAELVLPSTVAANANTGAAMATPSSPQAGSTASAHHE